MQPLAQPRAARGLWALAPALVALALAPAARAGEAAAAPAPPRAPAAAGAHSAAAAAPDASADSGWKKGVVRHFTPEQVEAIVESGVGPVIVDARSYLEFKKGHVPGAMNVPHKETWGRIEELRQYQDRGLVYYCTRGARSKIATDGLVLEGFPKVGVMTGYFDAWQAKGLPIETGPPRLGRPGEY